MIKKLGAALCLLTAVGCASQPDEMTASHVSDRLYSDLSCNDLKAELIEVSSKKNDLETVLEKEADNDAAQTAIGLILFWPALFLLEGGDGTEATEYRRLKGTEIALNKSLTKKDC